MREVEIGTGAGVGAEELYAACDAPFLHRQVDPAALLRAWVADDGRSAVWCSRSIAPGIVTAAVALGETAAVRELLALAARSTPPPDRVSVEAHAAGGVPQAWRATSTWSWHWMTADTERIAAPEADVDRVRALGHQHHEEISVLLEAGNPGSFARPGTPGVLGWHGVRDQRSGTLVATGCLVGQPDGSSLLRGVTTHPEHRGRGLGRLLSSALTRAALLRDPAVALGVYTDNDPALRIYRSLGYTVVHSFVSGSPSVVDAASTTAADPSRK